MAAGDIVTSPEMISLLEMSAKTDVEKQRQQTVINDLAEKQLNRITPGMIPEQSTIPSQPTYTPPPVAPSSQVLETLNKPIDYLGEQAGRAVQSWVDPVANPNLSDIAGGLTKAAVQYSLPGVALKGLGAVANAIGRFTPGAQGGRMESLIGKTENVLQSGLTRAEKSEKGYGKVFEKHSQSKVPMSNTRKTINEMQARESVHGIQSGVGGDLERIESALQKQSNAPTLSWIDDEMTRVGEKTKVVQGVKPDKAYQQVYAAMIKDLEQSPSGRGINLRSKDEATRRRLGYENLIDEFNGLVKMKRGQEGAIDINANQLMNKLKKNEFLRDSLREDDWKEITPLLTKLADTAVLPPARGVRFGSGRAAAVGGAAYALGGPVAGSSAAFLDYAASHLFMTRNGRKLVKAVLDMPSLPKIEKLNAINGMGRLAEKSINQLGE